MNDPLADENTPDPPKILLTPVISWMLYMYISLLLKSEYVEFVIPNVKLIVIIVTAPDLIDKNVAPELATSEHSIFVVLNIGVITCVCAVRLDTVKLVADVIVGCFCANRLSTCVMVYAVN